MKKYLKVKFLGSRITGFLCLFCCLIMFAFECYGQQTKREKITLSVVNLPVREVIRNIEKQTDYRFFYSENLKDLDKPVSIKCENVGIESAMQKILSGTSLDYKINENRVVSIVPKTQSKERPERLTGSIVDEKGIPLIGVSVLIKGSSQGTITDIDGKFHLDNVDPSSTVVFSYIGYETIEKPVNGKRELAVILKENSHLLKEVVVVGYGAQRKVNLSGILTPRFTPSCTDELMRWLGKLAAERGLYVQSHLSENKGEIAWVKELCPDCAQYWESYDRAGLWKDHTVMAHCVHSDEREREAMREHGVVTAHCAGSNINICSGVAPVRTLLREGNLVTLGSDIAGGALLAMNKVITMSIRASKFRHMQSDGKDEFLTVEEGYYLGSSAGHEYFGGHGGFVPGDYIHAIVVDDSDFTEAAHPLSVRERFERAIYMMHRHNIVSVWSEGKNVVC